MLVRRAVATDLDRIAALHAERIGEGFLPTLGQPFLRRLYRRVLRSRDAFLLVADAGDGSPALGFVAGVADLPALYRRFVVRDGVVAGAVAAPRLLGSASKVIETLRYPATADPSLPRAEILAVAVDTAAAGRGVGAALMGAAARGFAALGVAAAKVVTTPDNAAALRLYRSAGYVPRARVAVHGSAESEVLVWNSSSG